MNPYLPKMSPTAGKGLGGLPRRASTAGGSASGDWDGSWLMPVYNSEYHAVGGDLHGLFFSPDGLKLYAARGVTDTIYRFPLTSAFDLSTCGASDQSYSVGTNSGIPMDVFFNSTGTRMFVAAYSYNSITQYNLSTGWDLSTAAYSTIYSASSEDTYLRDVSFSSDGKKMFILGDGNEKLFQYTLTTAWEISSGVSYDSVSLNVASEGTGPQGVCWNTDGTIVWVCCSTTDKIYQYSMGTPWDLTGATYDDMSLSVADVDAYPSGIFFNQEYKKFFLAGQINNRVYEYDIEGTY